MRSAVGCSRDDQPMPMHGDGLRDIVADLRHHLLAAPHAYRRPEIGCIDAVGGRLAVAHKAHRAGSGVEPDRPAGVGSELNRKWKRWLRAILRMHAVWAERAGGERPCSHSAAEERDELAPLHSITSSARASTEDGISSPSVFAVFRFTTNSYLVGCCTGRSAGFAPFRMRST